MGPATHDGVHGRIQGNPGLTFRPGERFMNIDVASLLEEQAADMPEGMEAV